ncbi:unnamed protein product [Prunus brigantina]
MGCAFWVSMSSRQTISDLHGYASLHIEQGLQSCRYVFIVCYGHYILRLLREKQRPSLYLDSKSNSIGKWPDFNK